MARALCGYLKASFLFTQKDSLSEEEADEMLYLMKNIPQWKRKVAGRTPPIEKFVEFKSKRFLKSQHRLVIPVLEVLYLWNAFNVIRTKRYILKSFLRICEEAERDTESRPDTKFYWEDLSLVLLIKAACLRFLDLTQQSEMCLKRVLSYKKKIKNDTYLIPFCCFELAFLYYQTGRQELALEMAEESATKYTGFLLENRLRMRANCLIREIKKMATGSGESICSVSDDESGNKADKMPNISEECEEFNRKNEDDRAVGTGI